MTGTPGREPPPTSPQGLILPPDLGARLVAQARRAFPREACGLLVGYRDGPFLRVEADHPVPNTDPHPETGFAIAPEARLAVLRAARDAGRRVLGSWHSHPTGRAAPSSRDAALAQEPGLVWLILGLAGASAIADLRAFLALGHGGAHCGHAFSELPLIPKS